MPRAKRRPIDATYEADTSRSEDKPKAPERAEMPSFQAAPTALQAPSEDYLLSLRAEKLREYGPTDQQIDDMRRNRKLEYRVDLPDGCKWVDVEVKDPTIADETQRVVATLTLNPAHLTVTPARKGETAEANATLREEWTEAVLEAAGSRVAGQRTLRAVTDAAAGDGGGWTKLLFTRDSWDERYALRRSHFGGDAKAFDEATEDAKKNGGVPFAWVNVDVRTVYPTWSKGKLTEVLEITRRPLHAALRQYRLGLDKQGRIVPEMLGLPMNEVEARRIPQTVEFLEHWDDIWCTYMVVGAYGDRRVVQQFKHRMGRVPYFFAPGYTFNFETNIKAGWGVAHSKRWLVEYKAFLLTLHAQQAARDTFAPFYRTLDPKSGQPIMGKDGRPLLVEKYKLGQIVNGPPGSALQPFPFPTTSQALKEQIAYVSEMIERLMTPRVTANIGSGLEGAGFAMNQVLSEARIYQDPIAQSIENMLGEVTRFLWHLVRTRVREKVWVERSGESSGWLGAGPEDLTAGVGIKWQLDPERPSAKLVEERYWHERIDKGTASVAQSVEAMGDNPEEVRFQRDLEALRSEPWYRMYRQKYLLKEVGRGDLLGQAAEMAAITGALPGVPADMAAGATGAMGSAGIPDMGALAAAPGGPQPAAPQSLGSTVPTQSAASGMQLAA